MLKRFLHSSLIVTVALAAQAQGGETGYLTAGTQPVLSGHGAYWRTAAVQRTTYSMDVLFDFERAELGAEGRKLLDDLAQRILGIDAERVAVAAHTDRIGDAAYNERLAARRAQAIRAYLVEKGVPEKLLQIESKGAREPVTAGRCDTMGPESRQNTKLIACLQPDRRVEIEVAGNLF